MLDDIIPDFVSRSDLMQDLIGARALLARGDPYPVLGPALAQMGVDWPIAHRSTHPPTAFLFLLPVAGFDWEVVAYFWMGLTLACIAATGWALGVRWRQILLLAPPILIWPPTYNSLGQFTAIWMLGLALAWKYRERPFVAGVCIGVASLTKLMPAIVLGHFVFRREWRAVWGVGAAWMSALMLLLILNPASIAAYAAISLDTSADQVARLDNGSLLRVAIEFGPAAVVIACLLLIVVLLKAIHDQAAAADAWDRWVWLSVALLPIAWIYSLLPILPGLVRQERCGRPFVRGLSWLALAIPFFGPVPGGNPELIALTLALSGLASSFACQDRSKRAHSLELRQPDG